MVITQDTKHQTLDLFLYLRWLQVTLLVRCLYLRILRFPMQENNYQ